MTVIGRRTIKGRDILNVDDNPSTGLGVLATIGSIALSPFGTFTKTGALDTNWSYNTTTPMMGVARFVYLVDNVSDQTKMGGTSNGVYITFQSAYDNANVLQTLTGGKVVIMVGNTTAGVVGNLSLTSAWNSNVSIVGNSVNSSSVGIITATTPLTISINVTNVLMSTINSIGGNITITMTNSQVFGSLNSTSTTGNSGNITVINSRNSNTGNITTSSTLGNSGNILITSCTGTTVGNVISNAVLGNVGTLTYTGCSNVSTSAITMTQTSTTASFSVGAFTMTNCNDCRFSSAVIITMAFATSTGTIGGLIIGASNQGTIFASTVRVTGYANTTNIASDVVINSILLFDCKFTNLFCVNNRTTGGFNNWEGGTITSVNIQRCVFMNRTRIMYHNVTSVIGGASFRISDCIFKGSTDSSGMDFYVQNTDVSFGSFIINKCQSNFQNGFAMQYNGAVPPTVPFIIDGASIQFNDNDIDFFYPAIYNPTLIPNSVDDFVISGCNFYDAQLVDDGDTNYNITNTGARYNFFLSSLSVITTKTTTITGCNLNSDRVNDNLGNAILIKNSYLGYMANADNTVNLTSYNSFIESFALTGTLTTWLGSIKTSTLRRLVTDSVVGLTVSANSLDESY